MVAANGKNGISIGIGKREDQEVELTMKMEID